jgi:hypothetical protein
VEIHPGLVAEPIYLDYNATTPVDPRVAEAALPYLTHHFGNPSSGHRYADQPRAALAAARTQVANPIGAERTGCGGHTKAMQPSRRVSASRGNRMLMTGSPEMTWRAISVTWLCTAGFLSRRGPGERHQREPGPPMW